MTHRDVLKLLRAYESQNVTCVAPDLSAPIVWQRARGSYVWDTEGKKYLDLTAAFGVAAAGHANLRVVNAAKRQMTLLLHAMGDVFPHLPKAWLARKLSKITFERWTSGARQTGKTIFCSSGFEAVEAALKTAMLATGKPGIVAFEGAYHGVGYGALNATHRQHFRQPFGSQLRSFGQFVPFPTLKSGTSDETSLTACELRIRASLNRHKIGAILVEPVQVRGGINVPPSGFLPLLRRLCDENHCLLILDEIYTGFGRTGKWFACEHSKTIPDVICLGKALTGGFPLSACIGKAQLMDNAWPRSQGEAIHTSTFLGHPVGCAMALAHLDEIRIKRLVEKSARLGKWLFARLSEVASRTNSLRHDVIIKVRGLGLLAGVEFHFQNHMPATSLALEIIREMLQQGFIMLPEGEFSNVISFTPPLTVRQEELGKAVKTFERVVGRLLAFR